MAESLDPDVVAAVRRITDRALRLGEATPKHEVRVKLGRKRLELDRLEREGFVRTFGDNYLPGLRADELEDAATRNLVHRSTGQVLRALKSLYAQRGPKECSAKEVEVALGAYLGRVPPGDAVRIGLLFAVNFTKYFTSWSHSAEGMVASVTPKEQIIDFDSVDADWEESASKSRALSESAEAATVTSQGEEDADAPAGSRERWQNVRPLGSGGQGTVWLVRDTSRVNLRATVDGIKASVGRLASMATPEQAYGSAANLAEKIQAYQAAGDPENCGALKVLHEPENPVDLEKQLERMRREVEGVRTVDHPNIVKVLDANLDERWFVTEYFPDGPLSGERHRGKYRGRVSEALLALRPLVAGVAELHARKLVHRDIKPENIFVSPDRGLVLGDFGLVFFADEQRTRISETLENVGSRDWMPGWAMTISLRVEDITPAFDVFSLGKILWSMVAGGSKLRLWYKHEPGFELKEMFPDDPDVHWANAILDKCVVEHEKDCLLDAGALLAEVDRAIFAIRHDNAPLSHVAGARCRFCGLGTYQRAAIIGKDTSPHHVGLMPWDHTQNGRVALLRCDHCGHLEWFQLYGVSHSDWWDN